MIDVPVEHAVLEWNDGEDGGLIVVVDYRKPVDKFASLMSSAGACDVGWEGKTTNERFLSLLASGWGAVLRDGVAIKDLHQALCTVPEYRRWAGRELRGTSSWSPEWDDEDHRAFLELPNGFEEQLDGTVTIPLDHPYVAQFDATIAEIGGNIEVRWCDFGTTRQERFCKSRDEAEIVAAERRRSAHIIEYPLNLGQTIVDLDRYWRQEG